MSDHVIMKGMVLTAMPIGDYDKRITILTLEAGKITAFARGARRPNSQLLACTNPFCFGEFELIEGKTAYSLTKASIKNYFRELTADPEAVYTGFYFLEFAAYFCQENNDEREMLKLLYQSLRALGSPSFSRELVRVVFELKAISINGQGPEVFGCMHCRRKDSLRHFSIRRGGVFCTECGKNVPGEAISEAALYTMQFIIATPPEKLYRFSVSTQVLQELAGIMEAYLQYYVHHNFKSLQILRDLK